MSECQTDVKLSFSWKLKLKVFSAFLSNIQKRLSKMTKVPSVIHWFRLDLRIHDNLALRNAINEVSYSNNQSRLELFVVYF